MNTIKRICLLLAISLLTVGAASAQLRWGVRAGLNINNLHLTDPSNMLNDNNKLGWNLGVMAEFQVPIVGLCLDASIMYARMNANVSASDNLTDVNGNPIDISNANKDSKNFFEIPINVKYKFAIPAVDQIVAPFLFTGPDFAFKLGGKDDVFKTKTFQCAWNIGVGVEVARKVQLFGSYGIGMNNVFDKMGINVNKSDDIKAKNNYWTISAAYLF